MKSLLLLLGFVGGSVLAAPTVTDVVAKQRYPWNGLVDITCKVEGMTDDSATYKFFVDAVFEDFSTTQRVKNIWAIRNGIRSDDLFISNNGDYHLLWDAKADLGEVRYTNMVVRVTVDNKIQLWKSGPYWATTNIGAEKPEDYGYYFWWGDTVGYKRENNKWVASDGSNSNFSFTSDNTSTYNKSVSTLQSEGWITSGGVLSPEHDAAQRHWGGDWRMPTKQEFDDLDSKCDWIWTTLNGIKGYIVRGRGDYALNSIFLPCAGSGDGTSLGNVGSYGFCRSSVPDSDNRYYAWYLLFSSSSYKTYSHGRNYGQPVRPLQGFTK